MKRIWVPLIVVQPDTDDRSPQEIADAIVAALSLDPDVIDCEISAGIAKEVVS